jgi:Ca2+-binding RTX toxin-like protein
MRRTALFLATVAAVFLACGAAAFAQQANVINCPPAKLPPPDEDPPPCLGTDGADVIKGSTYPECCESIWGLGGDDKIYGRAGIDHIAGDNPGDPTVTGNDTIHAGAGGGSMSGMGGDDLLIGGSSTDLTYGDDGNDRLVGKGKNDRLDGGPGDDLVIGGASGGGPDQLFGDVGADLIDGGNGTDLIYTASWTDEWNDRPTDGRKDVVSCGLDYDTVWYKKGEDEVADDCEELHEYQLPSSTP